jgi:hypothetical protein
VTKQSFQYDFNGVLVETKVGNGAATRYVRQFLKWHQDGSAIPGKVTETLHAVLDVENGERHWKLTELFGGDVSREYVTLPASQPLTPSQPIWSRVLNSSGETIVGPGTTGTPDDRESFHGGQQFGIPTGIDLVHLGARVLTRKDGYWAQPEPLLWLGVPASMLSSPQALHPFRYAGNNPIMMNDPSGFASGALTPNDEPLPDNDAVPEPYAPELFGEKFGDEITDFGALALVPRMVAVAINPEAPKEHLWTGMAVTAGGALAWAGGALVAAEAVGIGSVEAGGVAGAGADIITTVEVGQAALASVQFSAPSYVTVARGIAAISQGQNMISAFNQGRRAATQGAFTIANDVWTSAALGFGYGAAAREIGNAPKDWSVNGAGRWGLYGAALSGASYAAGYAYGYWQGPSTP